MAIPPDVFEALLRSLREDPERRAALRSLLFEELGPWERVVRAEEETKLALSALAEAQRRTEENLSALTARVDELAQRVEALTARVDALTARVDELAQRVDALAEAQRRTEENLSALTARVDELARGLVTLTQRVEALATRVGDLDGDAVERRYRERPFAYLWRIALGLEALSSRELDELLREVAEAGGLTEGEEADVRLADAVFKGRRRDDGAEVVVVLEAAATLDAEDVERVLRRSAVLGRGRRPVVPVVAGRQADPALAERARARGVWVALDGRILEPAGLAGG
jgi:outer membrane murein-binding lipoprotein Lpp